MWRWLRRAVGKAGDRSPKLRDGRRLEKVIQRLWSDRPYQVEILGRGSNECWAFRLRVGERLLKAYECESAAQARQVQEATRILASRSVPIPALQAVDGHIVFAKWTEGCCLDSAGGSEIMEKMVIYQGQIHQTPPAAGIAEGAAELVHVRRLLHRLDTHGAPIVGAGRLRNLRGAVSRSTPPRLETRVIHPDFIRANIVVTDRGELVIVDNEFLGIGLGFEFDILNAARIFAREDEDLRAEYIAAYSQRQSCGTLRDHREFWDACYWIKKSGKAFMRGEADKGQEFLKAAEKRISAYADRSRA